MTNPQPRFPKGSDLRVFLGILGTLMILQAGQKALASSFEMQFHVSWLAGTVAFLAAVPFTLLTTRLLGPRR